MAITIKEKQALGFLPTMECGCGNSYCQPIELTDMTWLQGCVTNFDNVNLFTDGEFASSANFTLGAGWTITGGNLVGVNVGGQAIWNGTLGLVVGKLYLIQTVVTVNSVGSATPGTGWNITVNNDLLELQSGQVGTGSNASLTGSWLYSPTAIVGDTIIFDSSDGTIDFTIDYLRVYEVSTPEVALVKDGVIVEDNIIDNGAVSFYYEYNGVVFTTGSDLYEGTLPSCAIKWFLLFPNWSDVTDQRGCMTVRVYDTYVGNTQDTNESNCINLQSSHSCTLYFYALNNDSAYDLGDMPQYLRCKAKIKYSGYPEEKEVFGFSSNLNALLFAKQEKEYTVTIGDADEHIHDCISLMRLYDTFQIEIDGTMVDFVPVGDYELNTRKSSVNSTATFTVKKKQGISSNYNCE